MKRRAVRPTPVGRAALGVSAAALLVAACSGQATPKPTPSPQDTPPQHGSIGAVASAGCRAPSSPEVTNRAEHLRVAGATRAYLLTTPAPHRQPAPVVVDFHGYGEGDTTESLTTQFGPLGQHDGFISVFPEGTGQPIAWNTSTAPGNPDVRYLRALLTHLEATQCVDEARIYATGLSQGAFMTSTTACVLSRRFAAFAPVAGVELPHPCPASRPVPILAFHGTADPILHFNGGVGTAVLQHDLHAHPAPLPKLPRPRLDGPGYPANVRAWAAKDGCRTRPTDARLSPHVIHRAYSCPPGVAVEFDIILGGGHAWPGSAFSAEISQFVGHTTTEINATSAIWAFFQRFHLSIITTS
jgi:polyhydroxybutyrate depolymerase